MNFLRQLFYPARPLYYISICTIIKDENSYLEEWMNYHLSVGVQHFYLYDNESRTPIADTLALLNKSQFATVTTIEGKVQQMNAYNHCLNNFGRSSKWIAFIDSDEFIVPKNTSHNLSDLLPAYEKFGGLGVNWMLFGSSGHIARTGKPQLESFQMRAKDNFDVNRHIKTIAQPRYTKRARGAHSFDYLKSKFCVNENSQRIDGEFSDVSTSKIQLNHYYCRSLEEYQEKIQRGIADTDRPRKLEEFHAHDVDSNEVRDTIAYDISQNRNKG